MPTTASLATTSGALWLGLSAVVHDHDWAGRDRIAQRMGLPFSRYRALRRLEVEPLRQRVLAQRLGIDAPAASVIIGDLVAHGFAVRHSDPADARCKVVSITAAGIALMDEIRSLPGLAPSIVDRLTDSDREHLAHILDVLRAVRS